MTAADRTLQSEARRLEVATLVALILMSVLLALRSIAIPVVAAMSHSAPGSMEFWREAAPALIPALPAFVLLGALDAARKLLSHLAKGDTFGDSVGQGVRGIGTSLLWAAAAMAVVVPWLEAWVDGRYGFGGIKLEPITIVLGLVGAVLLLLGRLFKRAGALKSELEQFV